jgi:hypothetical protein
VTEDRLAAFAAELVDLHDGLRADPRELDGLAAVMESHFAFQERRVLAALRA